MDRRAQLLLEKRRYNLPQVISDFELQQLNNGVPIQKIIGYIEMANVKINLERFVLIPRYETEELIFKILEVVKNNSKILDLGCGSGFIGIALKKNNPSLLVSLSDIDDEAIIQTKQNIEVNNVKCQVIKSDLFNNISDKNFDLIVSNPPYLMDNEEISPLVTNHEPKLALFAKNNGLFFYEAIFKKGFDFLTKEGEIWFEINPLHLEYWEKKKKEYNLNIYNDIANLPRFVRIKKSK